MDSQNSLPRAHSWMGGGKVPFQILQIPKVSGQTLSVCLAQKLILFVYFHRHPHRLRLHHLYGWGVWTLPPFLIGFQKTPEWYYIKLQWSNNVGMNGAVPARSPMKARGTRREGGQGSCSFNIYIEEGNLVRSDCYARLRKSVPAEVS